MGQSPPLLVRDYVESKGGDCSGNLELKHQREKLGRREGEDEI